MLGIPVLSYRLRRLKVGSFEPWSLRDVHTQHRMPFKFEKLEVWQESVELTGLVHEVCLTFPKEELYILTAQLRRAADSISLNIAEGSTGQPNKEFRKFLGYSIRSGAEVIGCIYLAKRRNLISEKHFQSIYDSTDKLVMRIQALRNSIK